MVWVETFAYVVIPSGMYALLRYHGDGTGDDGSAIGGLNGTVNRPCCPPGPTERICTSPHSTQPTIHPLREEGLGDKHEG